MSSAKNVVLSNDLNQIKAFLDKAVSNKDTNSLIDFVQDRKCCKSCNLILLVCSETPQITESALEEFATKITKLPPDEYAKVAEEALSSIDYSQFEKVVIKIREDYATVLESQKEYTKAARVLGGIQIESGEEKSERFIFSLYVRMAQDFLLDDGTVPAENVLKKASQYYYTSDDNETVLKYKVCVAQVQDQNRRFLKASRMYHDLSQRVKPEQQLELLNSAIICSILAPAGPERARQMSALFKDPRCSKLEIYPAMEKMFVSFYIIY